MTCARPACSRSNRTLCWTAPRSTTASARTPGVRDIGVTATAAILPELFGHADPRPADTICPPHSDKLATRPEFLVVAPIVAPRRTYPTPNTLPDRGRCGERDKDVPV